MSYYQNIFSLIFLLLTSKIVALQQSFLHIFNYGKNMFHFSPTSQLGAGGVRSAANNSFTPVLAHSSKGSKVWYIVWRGRGERLSGRPSAFSSPRVPDQTFSLGGGLARGERRKMMLRKQTSISRMSAKEITMGKIQAVLKE